MPNLGPIIMGTLLTRELAKTVEAYCKFLHSKVLRRGKVSLSQVKYWDVPSLQGNPYVVIANENGRPWLRIIEDTQCLIQDTLKHTGWMSLEVLVDDVDTLADTLKNSPFEILRPAADLDVSDKIRAVQVKGPCGEILYLTQIKGQVPPFKLPRATCLVDHLFIPVLCTHDRDISLAFYEALSGNDGLKFETKITVINHAYGYDLDQRHAVATLQLRGNTLIEIDEIKSALPIKAKNISGIFMISCNVDKLPNIKSIRIKNCRATKQKAGLLTGPSGELFELIETSND